MRGVGDRRALRVEAAAALQFLGEQFLDLPEVTDDQPAGAGAVGGLVLHVRQPLGPLPLGLRARRRHHGDDQVLRRVQGAQLREDGARRPVHGVRVAGDRQVVEGAQRDRERELVQVPVLVEELLHRVRGERFQFVDRRGLRRLQGSGQLLRAESHPYLCEVGVGSPAFPHPFAFGDDRPQLPRIGVQEKLRVTLFTSGAPHFLSLLRQVFEVILALLEHLPGRPLAGLDDLDNSHREGGNHHHAAHDLHERLGAHEQETRRTRHAHHRHEVHQHVVLAFARQLRRSFERQLLTGDIRWKRAGRALDDDNAHRGISPSCISQSRTAPVGSTVPRTKSMARRRR